MSTETYESVRAVIAKVGSPKANGYDMVFAVTEFNEGVPLPVVFVPDEVFVRIMDDISSAYKTHRQTIPPLITDITQRFPRLRPSQYLLFKQAGPRDWSIPPFSIAIGVASENTWLTIYVSTETYESVRAVIAKAGFPKTNGYDMVFAVTEFTDGSPLSVVFVPDEVVVQVMGDISSTYKAHHQTIPPMISTIMKSFPRPRYSLDPQ
ncbi:hypothetical protein AGMMS50225_18840 [Betaproteobacteria bacterium]|nr:hypothetical protein AGMMS50225_18840 [Betaproteobacteria bacterium]